MAKKFLALKRSWNEIIKTESLNDSRKQHQLQTIQQPPPQQQPRRKKQQQVQLRQQQQRHQHQQHQQKQCLQHQLRKKMSLL